MVKRALLEAWLVARPEFVWCTRERNCLQIYNMLNERIAVDEWNDITRIYYVVVVNNVTFDPTTQNSYAPSINVLKATIQKIQKNFYQTYLICGALVDSTHIYRYTIYSPFPLILNSYMPDGQFASGQSDTIASILTRAISATNPYVVDLNTLVVMFNTDYQDVLVLKTFYDSIGSASFDISNELV